MPISSWRLGESLRIQWYSSTWISHQQLTVAAEQELLAEEAVLWEFPHFLESELRQKYSEHYRIGRCEKWPLQDKRSVSTIRSQCLNQKAAFYWIKIPPIPWFPPICENTVTFPVKWCAGPGRVYLVNEKLFMWTLKFQNSKLQKIQSRAGLVWLDSLPDHSSY